MIILSSSMAFPPSQYSFMFQTHLDRDHLPSLPPAQHLHGIVKNKFGEVNVGEDEFSDDGTKIGEKKKRLNFGQVKALEKSFELGDKLEPERKMQLSEALGLQPRQIAIWFQNRRARRKTKQLEKEYDVLKKQFEALKSDNEALKVQNQKLHAELEALGGKDFCGAVGTIGLVKETKDSPAVSSHNSKSFLIPTNSLKPTSISQLLQCSSTSDKLHDQSFSNMFHVIDEQQPNSSQWKG